MIAATIQVEAAVARGLVRFLRGNCNGDAALDISDAVYHLAFLFSGGPPSDCHAACDSDGNGLYQITDPIRTLSYLFLGFAQPGGMFPECELAVLDCGADTCSVR